MCARSLRWLAFFFHREELQYLFEAQYDFFEVVPSPAPLYSETHIH